jgi:hypothetical protein
MHFFLEYAGELRIIALRRKEMSFFTTRVIRGARTPQQAKIRLYGTIITTERLMKKQPS